MKIREIEAYFETLYPAVNKCTWDNDGLLLCLDRDREVTRALTCLDVTFPAIEAAKEHGCDVLISEIEIFGTPAAYKGELVNLVKKYAHFGGDTSDELYVTASAAAGDAASRQGYVDLLVKKMTPVVEELEVNYVEPPTEEDTQAVTPETEDVTQILAPADTEEPADADEETATEAPTNTDAPSTVPEDSGCGSSIGFGVAGLLTAMAAAVALKKKH